MTNKESTRREICAAMATLWGLMPDLRFTQLVQLVAGEDDPFYMNDYLFKRKAEKLLGEKMREAGKL